MSFEGRLTRAETATRKGLGGACPECNLLPHGRGYIVLVDEGDPESFKGDPDERCSRCGRLLWCVIEIVYGDDSPDVEGGGTYR